MLRPEEYLVLKEKGIDIAACNIDFQEISVLCEDLSRFRKALRVKIRALIKEGDKNELRTYTHALYQLAHFSRYLYGFHSCNSRVERWQEELALWRQKDFDQSRVMPYEGKEWLCYKDADDYSAYFKGYYEKTLKSTGLKSNPCLQDEKPFLNLKDRAHFDKCL